MAERENTGINPYEHGEFFPLAHALDQYAGFIDGLSREQRSSVRGSLALSAQAMRFGAEALRRAELLLAPGMPLEPGPPLVADVPQVAPEPATPVVESEPSTGTLEVGQRGEWRGRVGRQPEFERLQTGRVRAVFYLAPHNDPTDPEKTEWLRCYNLDRYAEALRKKGRLAGAEVLIRGAFQGERTITRKHRPPQQQKTIYCYGVRVLQPSKDTAPASPQNTPAAQPEHKPRRAERLGGSSA
jgi:hypothetical protein